MGHYSQYSFHVTTTTAEYYRRFEPRNEPERPYNSVIEKNLVTRKEKLICNVQAMAYVRLRLKKVKATPMVFTFFQV